MPHSQEKTPEQTTELPNPELNPLLNPTLGRHLGRWAQVYFTSPPEKREEAVEELLRELQGDSPATQETIASMPADSPTLEAVPVETIRIDEVTNADISTLLRKDFVECVVRHWLKNPPSARNQFRGATQRGRLSRLSPTRTSRACRLLLTR